MQRDSYNPGDIAVWHTGSYVMSWPPDGERERLDRLESFLPDVNTIVLIISKVQHHGVTVLVNDRLWWCPLASLRGELSSSCDISFEY